MRMGREPTEQPLSQVVSDSGGWELRPKVRAGSLTPFPGLSSWGCTNSSTALPDPLQVLRGPLLQRVPPWVGCVGQTPQVTEEAEPGGGSCRLLRDCIFWRPREEGGGS